MTKPVQLRVKITGKPLSRPINVNPNKVNPDKAARELYVNLYKRTPIDTGNARGGWHINLMKNGNYQVANDVEYVQYLEDGHSQQAPRGFQNQAIRETRSDIKEMQQKKGKPTTKERARRRK